MMKPSRTSLGSWLALAAGLLAAASLVWFVGPLLVLGGWRPFESVATRALLVTVMLLLPLSAALWRHLRDQRLARRAAQAADTLDTAVDQALLRLRARPAVDAIGWHGWLVRWRQFNGPDPLLALPWVLVIGLPGADKRRALAAAGFDLPLRSTAGPPCTWCITPQGVLIDVAEDLLTERHADWLHLLKRLQQARPLQPVSAVLLMLPASERAGQVLADLAPQAAMLMLRQTELMQITGMTPPVHLAITGCDRLPGFPGADLQQRLQAAASRLGLVALIPPPAALLGADASALRRLIDDQVLAPVARPQYAHRWLRRQRWQVRMGYGLTLMVAVWLGAGWFISHRQNQGLIDRQQRGLATAQAALGAAQPALAGGDIGALLPALAGLQQAVKDADDAPWTARLGLFQGHKLQAFADLAYQRVLQDGLAPALLSRLEGQLRDTLSLAANQHGTLYDTLRLYLGLLQRTRRDDDGLGAALLAQWPGLASLPPAQQKVLHRHLEALLDAGGAPARPADEALVAQARQVLARTPLDQLLSQHFSLRHAAAGSPQLTLQGLVGAQDLNLFVRRSGRPMTDGVPTLYTLEGIARFVAPVLKGRALAEMREVLGQAPLPTDAATAADSSIQAAALQQYIERYIGVWDGLLADLSLVPLAELEGLGVSTRQLTAINAPLALLLRSIAKQTNAGPPLSALPVSTPTLQLDQHFAALQQLVTGEPPPLDAALAALGELAQQISDMGPTAALRDLAAQSPPTLKLRELAVQLPPPVRNLLAPADRKVIDAAGAPGAADAPGAAGAASTATDFATLQQQCQRSAANRYPLVATAKAEMSLADFGALFGAGTGFDAYFQRWLAPLVDVSTRPWAWRPGSAAQRPVPTAALASFEQAARIREALFDGGSRQATMRVTLAVTALDDSVPAVELRLNDQTTRLQVGQGAQVIAWPGQPALQRISLGAAGGKAPELSFQSAWSLPRLMDALTLQPSRAPQRYFAKLPIGGQPAELALVTDSASDLGKAQLRAFRCPAAAEPKLAAQPANGVVDRRISQTNRAPLQIKQQLVEAVRSKR